MWFTYNCSRQLNNCLSIKYFSRKYSAIVAVLQEAKIGENTEVKARI